MNPPSLFQLSHSEKVVIQFGNRAVKGYFEPAEQIAIERQLENAADLDLGSIRIRHADSDLVEVVQGKDIKAIFFVNSFEGNAGHKHLNFSSRAPVVDGIWMRVKFRDGEVMEGIVSNTLHYLVAPGFLMLPTDPGSNNKLVYVVKSWLVDHRVLGMRKMPALPSNEDAK